MHQVTEELYWLLKTKDNDRAQSSYILVLEYGFWPSPTAQSVLRQSGEVAEMAVEYFGNALFSWL